MRENPRDGDIGDIDTVCRHFGIRFTAPQRGSHYKARHPAVPEILTIPARRPIKPGYVRRLVALIDAVEESKGKVHGER
jgi:hypothetical protein